MTNTFFTKHWLPARPYATNAFNEGLFRTDKTVAIEEKKFIQTAPKTYSNMLVLDLDTDNAFENLKTMMYDDEISPEANWVTINPNTSHAHAGFIIDGAVGTTKGLRYKKAIEQGLNQLLGGDEAYSGMITRNPNLHPTEWLSERIWTLPELHAYLKRANVILGERSVRPEKLYTGRNEEVFEELRIFSYEIFRKVGYSDVELLRALEDKATLLYMGLGDTTGFNNSELRGIIKSVFKFTSNNFSEKAFSEIQRARVVKRWGTKKADRNAEILFMKEQGFSFKDIAASLGIKEGSARVAYSRALKEVN